LRSKKALYDACKKKFILVRPQSAAKLQEDKNKFLRFYRCIVVAVSWGSKT
jgi:hypothetical protein